MESVTVLIIDPDEANRQFLMQMLQKKGYQAKQASSGAEGIKMVDEETPSLVVFDTNLPDMKSLELIERLQQNPKVADIPCVVLSSKSDPDEMRACLEAGRKYVQ